MRYMLINVANGNLQVDLYKPDTTYKNKNLHRVAPFVALNLKKGEGVDILPHFNGSLEDAHSAVRHSKDVLRMLKPSQLNIYVCDDGGTQLDIDELLGTKKKEEKVPEVVEQLPPVKPPPEDRPEPKVEESDEKEEEKKEEEEEKEEPKKKTTKKKTTKKKKGLFGGDK